MFDIARLEKIKARIRPKATPIQQNLKCVQPFFSQIESGEKSFEFRQNDRDFQVGDLLSIHELSAYIPILTDSPAQNRFVSSIVHGEQLVALMRTPNLEDYCIMSLVDPDMEWLVNQVENAIAKVESLAAAKYGGEW